MGTPSPSPGRLGTHSHLPPTDWGLLHLPPADMTKLSLFLSCRQNKRTQIRRTDSTYFKITVSSSWSILPPPLHHFDYSVPIYSYINQSPGPETLKTSRDWLSSRLRMWLSSRVSLRRCDLLENQIHDLHLKLADRSILSCASTETTQKRTKRFFSPNGRAYKSKQPAVQCSAAASIQKERDDLETLRKRRGTHYRPLRKAAASPRSVSWCCCL